MSGSSDGSIHILDDFRDSYRWLNQNTPEGSKIMSWDYGYQLAALANRTTIVDNNTWNNSHIALIGGCFAKNESIAYAKLRELDVDYVLVWFGGLVGYSSDDINKFYWMLRIGGTVDNTIDVNDYLVNGRMIVGENATRSDSDICWCSSCPRQVLHSTGILQVWINGECDGTVPKRIQ